MRTGEGSIKGCLVRDLCKWILRLRTSYDCLSSSLLCLNETDLGYAF